MRYYLTGIDDQGRSLITQTVERAGPVTGQSAAQIYRGPSTPPAHPAQAAGELLDSGLEPGETAWRVVEFPPGRTTPHHHTATVDFCTLIEGTVEFTTDAETVALEPGDCVLINGVSHAWHTEHGCRLLVAMLSTATG